MKVFKFTTESHEYMCSGKDLPEAITHFLEDIPYMISSFAYEEIPESEWDEENISIYEDNDITTEPFYISIREALQETPTILSTNDFSLIN